MYGLLIRIRFTRSQRKLDLALTLAHLSDIHLGPLPPGAAWKNFALKRVVGSLSWELNRHKIHDTAVAHAITEDIKAAEPDHVALTGDLVNVAAHAEFLGGAKWLKEFGKPSWISFVPGNHDAYVPVRWEQGLSQFAPYMEGEMTIPAPHTSASLATGFPYVRLRRNLAVIGLSTAEPQSLIKAAGSLGSRQLQALSKLLRDLKARGYYRAVMIHHPPLPGLAPNRKALTDAGALREVLVKEGAELVLHGHNHREMVNFIDGPAGKIPVIGVASASSNGAGHHEAAAWNLYEVNRNQGNWVTDVSVRGWDPQTKAIVAKRHFTLPS
jgi:3',5'-cyclic AMP phosphodiesterase CpdA